MKNDISNGNDSVWATAQGENHLLAENFYDREHQSRNEPTTKLVGKE